MEQQEEGEEVEEESLDMETIIIVQQVELFGISLHAIARSPSPKTMRLVGRINLQLVIILIDTGSTHSFIDVNVARRPKLPAKVSQLAVQVANGETLPCHGCCKEITFTLDHYDFMANLYLLTLGGCDIVLGVDLLRSLRTIQWNFVDLSMRFLVKGKQFLL